MTVMDGSEGCKVVWVESQKFGATVFLKKSLFILFYKDNEVVTRLREVVRLHWEDWGRCFKQIKDIHSPFSEWYQRTIQHLRQNKGDYEQAFLALPTHVRSMWVSQT